MGLRGLFLSGALLLLFAGGSAAQYSSSGMDQSQGSNAATQSISGTISNLTADALVITTDSGSGMSFKVDSQSNVPASLTTGDKVQVQYRQLSDGTYEVASLSMPGSSPASSGPGSSAPSSNGMSPSGTNQPATSPSMGGSNQSGAETSATAPLNNTARPATASPLPLIGLSGLLALGAGLGLRLASRS